MRIVIALGVALGILMPATARPAWAEDAADARIRKSVVKIEANLRSPDPYRPWNTASQTEVTGSGVVIAGKRILTSAHLVNHASQIYVQPDKSSEKLIASIVGLASGIDLALLKLDDESFFDSHPPLPTDPKLPELKQTVFTYGFPTGGSELSITRGIVSRVEYVEYYMKTEGLRIQVDAAINPGNSGGPAVIEGKLIGLVFSRLQQADNIGYIIPVEEIELFLKDIQDGRYDGKPVLEIEIQHLENQTLRNRFQIDKQTTGILVRKVHRHASSYPLRVGDVITKVGDQAVDNAGMVRLDGGRLIKYDYLIQRLTRDGRLPLVIRRDGHEVKLDLPVGPASSRLFPAVAEKPPSYFVFGPLAFTNVTDDYILYLALNSGADDGNPGHSGFMGMIYSGNPMFTRYGDRPAFSGERIVVVAHPMFAHKISKGYEDPYTNAVDAVNGIRIRNLEHLVEVVRDATGAFIEFTFRGQANDAIVFKRKEALDATEEILSDNGIRQQCSPDIAPIWNKKK
jgi:S1-C subfamily serine protease